jgi:LPS O-antigen subunit length determinant protein (WzzB/FepE family)
MSENERWPIDRENWKEWILKNIWWIIIVALYAVAIALVTWMALIG